MRLFAAYLTLLAAAPLWAQSYVDPAQTDADFPLQGEYVGKLTNPSGASAKIGLQVIALGEGKFRAGLYLGGLPGDGWVGNEIKRGEASRDGEKLTFDIPPGQIVVADGAAAIRFQEKEVGQLTRTVRKSPTLGAEPPEGAVVLFGDEVNRFPGAKSGDGLLLQGATSEPKFQSHQLHVEFRLPYEPKDRGQGRGNSGLYLQGRYEVQMLDSFGLEGKNNECGGIYSLKAPDVNMCFPPLTWQTYDIDFTAAVYEDGKLVEAPRMTVRHNGVVIHDNVALPRSTTAAPLKPGPQPGPVYLQNHGDPVRYRNIWVVPHEEDSSENE